MRKYLKIILMSVIFVMLIISESMAATGDAKVNFKVSAQTTNVNVNETFMVVLSQDCEDGLQGIETNLEYDSSTFELVDAKYNEKWSNFGDSNLISVISSDAEDIKSGEIVTLTFKALKAVNNGEIAFKNIETTKEVGNTVEVENQVITINAVGEPVDITTVTLSDIVIASSPTKTTYQEGEKFSTSGMKVIAKYSDNTEKEITNYTYEPSGSLTTNNQSIIISYTEGSVTKTVKQSITVNAKLVSNTNTNTNNTNVNNTTTTATAGDASTSNSTTLPKTGNTTMKIVVIIGVLIATGLFSYKQYLKYKEI